MRESNVTRCALRRGRRHERGRRGAADPVGIVRGVLDVEVDGSVRTRRAKGTRGVGDVSKDCTHDARNGMDGEAGQSHQRTASVGGNAPILVEHWSCMFLPSHPATCDGVVSHSQSSLFKMEQSPPTRILSHVSQAFKLVGLW